MYVAFTVWYAGKLSRLTATRTAIDGINEKWLIRGTDRAVLVKNNWPLMRYGSTMDWWIVDGRVNDKEGFNAVIKALEAAIKRQRKQL